MNIEELARQEYENYLEREEQKKRDAIEKARAMVREHVPDPYGEVLAAHVHEPVDVGVVKAYPYEGVLVKIEIVPNPNYPANRYRVSTPSFPEHRPERRFLEPGPALGYASILHEECETIREINREWLHRQQMSVLEERESLISKLIRRIKGA